MNDMAIVKQLKKSLIPTCSLCTHFDPRRSICTLVDEKRNATSSEYAKE